MEDLKKSARAVGNSTMDMLFKLKNTVSGALPGNPVTREFDIGRHVASAGPGLLWKVYDGVKSSTKEEASVFVFEKKLLERYSKKDREVIVETLKKGVSQLTRLRHPKILSVLHPIEESRDSLAFATERVYASLANMLGQLDNMPSPLPPEITDCKLYDLEIKYGLLQVTEGLAFLHNDVKMMHNNLCPESIIVVKNGAWKIAGFDLSLGNIGSDSDMIFPFKEWDPNFPHVAQPVLNYLAPEYALTKTCSTASDMYSLGILMYAIFNKGKTLFDCRNEMSSFKKSIEELRRLKISLLGSIPDDVREHVKMLLNAEPTVRPDAHQISKIPFFEDVGVMTLQYLDTLIQRDNLQKSQFFKGLPKILEKMPPRVCTQRILPCLFTEFVNHDMIPFVLQSVMMIANQLSDQEYVKHVFPSLIPAFRLTSPVQISLILMQHMNVLLKKTPTADVRNHILPMIYRALEAETPQIQEMCLHIIPTFADLIEYSSMKNAIMPRIRKLCLSTSLLGVRVNCLVCIGKLLEYMDKWFVLDEVLPVMNDIPSREPAVLMSILGIYQVAFTHKKLGITKDILATKVLPYLIPLSIDNNLNLKQFNAFLSVIKDMISKVESEHRGKLEQLNSMQQEQRTIQFGPDPALLSDTDLVGGDKSKNDSMMDKFLSGFGISSMLSSSAKTKKPGEGSPVNTAQNQPAPPSKVSLTMEEKQKLAKEQEQHERLKSQQPLNPEIKKAVTKNKPKDLTSTLMERNLTSMSYGASSTAGSGMGGGASFNSIPNSSTMYGKPSGAPVMSTGSGMMGTGLNQLSTTTGPQRTSSSQANRSVDLSAFDNLLPNSNQPKPTLSQMTQSRPGLAPRQGMMGGQQGMMGNQMGMMGSQQRMMGAPQGLMGGQQGMMGAQQGMMASQQGMMGAQQGMMGSQPGMVGGTVNQGMVGNPGIPGNLGLMGQSGMMSNRSGFAGGQKRGVPRLMSPETKGATNGNVPLTDLLG